MEPLDVERRLAAILAADMVEYTRHMGKDETGTHTRWKMVLEGLLEPRITGHEGRIVKTTGDGLLAEFRSAVGAVDCAVDIQRELATQNADLPEDDRIRFRLGVNLGDIIVEEDDIYGDGVNITSRLEAMADPGGVCISGKVYDEIRGKLDLDFEDLGPQSVKNIADPVRAYRVLMGPGAKPPAEPAPELTLPDRPSIAVLAFDNLSGEPEQSYFSDGISEDIITGLSRMRWLFVIARNSSFTYKGRAADLSEVSRELGVRYVLEGSVRRSGGRVRITAQLVDAASGGHVWAERYDRDLTDIFAVQDDITANIVTAIGPELTRAEIERARQKRPENLDAWDRYLRALSHLYRIDRDANRRAQVLLAEAAELDPRYAGALAWLAWSHTLDALLGWSASATESLQRAFQTAQTALALDRDDPLAHASVSIVLAFSGQHAKAVDAAERALELDPNFSVARGNLGIALAFVGRAEEAIGAFDRALRGSPRDPFRWAWFSGMAHAHFSAGRYEDAIDWEMRAIQLRPDWFGCHVLLTASLARLGRTAEAEAAGRELLRLVPRFSVGGAAKNPMFSRPEDVEALLDGLRRAGLPETAG